VLLMLRGASLPNSSMRMAHVASDVEAFDEHTGSKNFFAAWPRDRIFGSVLGPVGQGAGTIGAVDQERKLGSASIGHAVGHENQLAGLGVVRDAIIVRLPNSHPNGRASPPGP